MRTAPLTAASLLVASLAFSAPKTESRKADSIAIKIDGRWTTYADVTIHEAQAGYVHFTVNGGTVYFTGEPPKLSTNSVSRGSEIMHSGEYQAQVSGAKR